MNPFSALRCFSIACALVLAHSAAAQTAGAQRIGLLSPASASSVSGRVDAFRQGLADLGYREGQNIVIEYRWAEGKDDRLPGLAAELVKLQVAAIVAHGIQSAKAARSATGAIPIVCFSCGDVVATGLVTNLARPGGTITGMTAMHPESSGKRLELLKEIVPKLARVALLWNSRNPVSVPEIKETEAAAQTLGLKLFKVSVMGADELKAAFSSMAKEQIQGLVILSDATFIGYRNEIAALAQAHQIPTIAWTGELVDAGILISYGAEPLAQARRTATFVEKILKGAKPGDLPMQQPTEFELVLNLKSARALRLQIPQTVSIRATRVVQ